MIKHIVLFRIKESPPDITKEEAVRQLADCFSPLEKGVFSHEYRVGMNFSKSDNSWDVVIDSIFFSEEELEKYQVSSEHLEAINKASRFNKEKAVIDYKYQEVNR